VYLNHLSVLNYRSYTQAEIELEPGFTAFIGHNGQGKTNLVEAVGYLATLSSHRVSTSAPLVKQGAEFAIIRGNLARGDRSTLLEVQINPGKANRARINRSEVPRARDIIGYLRTVLFAPEDLALVKGDPDVRRRFLDDLLALLSPRLTGLRGEYDRILRQRNALLKSAGAMGSSRGKGRELPTLDVWDEHLANVGGQLLAARLRLVNELRPHVAQAYDEVSGGQGHAHIEYESTLQPHIDSATAARFTAPHRSAEAPDVSASEIPSESELAELMRAALVRLRPKELDRGVSLIGPHRDDLALQLGDLQARGYASHGESWSFALALRLASFRLLSEVGDDGEPILILDDVFAELDVKRRDRLADLVQSARQVLVTAAVPNDVPDQLAGARYDVHLDEVTRV